jgi:hypothetical protein
MRGHQAASTQYFQSTPEAPNMALKVIFGAAAHPLPAP